MNVHAINAPTERRPDAADASPSRRSRAKTLTWVHPQTRLGRRIAELKAIYIEALGGDAALSDLHRLKVAEAAQAKAMAEHARGRYLRGEGETLNQVIRAERRASMAERALNIVERAPKPPTLADVLHGRG